ncbi:MAG: pentapeptide repeat-containing protein [Bacteroidota bacterium]
MTPPSIYSQTFNHTNFGDQALAREYEDCDFVGCNFAEQDLSEIAFAECRFEDCDFSMAKIRKTAFKDVHFKRCKLMGLHFDDCNDFLLEMHFEHCLLNFAIFYQLRLKETRFEHCNLQEADFTEANLAGASFSNCDLQGAIFDQSDLRKADLRSAFNFHIDPDNNSVAGARFAVTNLAGLLKKYQLVIE